MGSYLTEIHSNNTSFISDTAVTVQKYRQNRRLSQIEDRTDGFVFVLGIHKEREGLM